MKGCVLQPNAVGLQSFRGRWTILREIRDEKNGQKGRLEGHAVFRPNAEYPNTMVLEERGQLQMEGAPALPAKRSYIWRSAEDGRMIDVSFADQRPFHRIDLACTMPFDTHFCAPDIYNVTYDFRSWPVWQAEWRVRGPRKDYRIWSRFRYIGDVSHVYTPCATAEHRAVKPQSPPAIERDSTWHIPEPTRS